MCQKYRLIWKIETNRRQGFETYSLTKFFVFSSRPIFRKSWTLFISSAGFRNNVAPSMKSNWSLRFISKFFPKKYRWWQWCWWHRYVGDFMMVTDLKCWWQNHYAGDFFRYVGDFLNVLNRSPTSWIGNQYLKLEKCSF